MLSAAVAVVTRTKNRPLLLRRAIQSVLAQTYHDWLMVIVNDGGDPEPVEELCKSFGTEFKEKHMIIHHADSVGMEEAGNRGVLACDSEFVVLHDDDDSWHPEFLSSCTEYLQQGLPNLGGVITHWKEVWERIDDEKVTKVKETVQSRLQFISFYEMTFRCTFVPACFLYRRSAWEKAGRYNADLPLAGDWDFNLRFLSHYEIGVIHRPLANYHRRIASNCNNAVQAAPHLLQECANRVRNEYLRKDLQGGQCGLGTLMGMSHQLSQASLWQFLRRDLALLKRRFMFSAPKMEKAP